MLEKNRAKRQNQPTKAGRAEATIAGGPPCVVTSVKSVQFLDHSCVILSSLKIVVIFDNTSADFVLISTGTDVISKMTTILKELRIGQL